MIRLRSRPAGDSDLREREGARWSSHTLVRAALFAGLPVGPAVGLAVGLGHHGALSSSRAGLPEGRDRAVLPEGRPTGR